MDNPVEVLLKRAREALEAGQPRDLSDGEFAAADRRLGHAAKSLLPELIAALEGQQKGLDHA